MKRILIALFAAALLTLGATGAHAADGKTLLVHLKTSLDAMTPSYTSGN